jgi:hypothetical protein
MRRCGLVAVLAAAMPAVMAGAAGCDCGGGGRSDGGGGGDAGSDAGPAADPTRIFYRPQSSAAAANPFPGDFLTVADPTSPTGRRVAIPAARGFPYADELNTLDGFLVTFGAWVRATRALDPASVLPGTMELYRYDSAGTGAVAPVAGTLEYVANETGVHFLPDRPLASRARYLVVVRPGLVDLDGAPVAASEGWEAAVAAATPEATEILAFLDGRAGVPADQVLHAHLYTTQTVAEDLVFAREALFAGPPPAVTIDDAYDPRDASGNLNPALLARLPPLPPDLPLSLLETDDVATVAFGHIETVEYRDADGHWTHDPVTFAPVPQGTLDLEFILTLPAGTAGPVPMIVFSHALGVCKETVIAIADTLAEYGLGAIGIDVIGHGSRATGGNTCGDNPSIGDFIDPTDLLKTREVFRQTVSDMLHLVRVLGDPGGGGVDLLPWTGDVATSGDGLPDFDTTRPTALVGQSLGSFIGTITSSVEPRIVAATLNVGGLSVLGVLAGALGGTGVLNSETTFATLMLLEPGDNWAYAPGLVDPFAGLTGAAPTSVLMQMAVGDDVVPNATSWAFARLVGLPLVTPAPVAAMDTGTTAAPVLPPAGPTLGLFAFDGVAHQWLLLPDDVVANTWAAQEQAAAFVWSAIDGAYPAPVIIDPFDPAQVAAYHP